MNNKYFLQTCAMAPATLKSTECAPWVLNLSSKVVGREGFSLISNFDGPTVSTPFCPTIVEVTSFMTGSVMETSNGFFFPRVFRLNSLRPESLLHAKLPEIYDMNYNIHQVFMKCLVCFAYVNA